MCLAEGASLRTAETVPADSPKWAATAFKVTTLPLDPGGFFSSFMSYLLGIARAFP
jgi:hypothetical protein